MNIPKYTNLFRKKLTLKNYSQNTISNYCCQVELFLKAMSNKFTEPAKVNETAILDYLLSFKTYNTNKHAQCALRLFYKETIRQSKKFRYIPYPKSEKKLPRVIDKDYLINCISKIQNLKHKAIIMLAFSTGMRVSEVCNLQLTDIDSRRMLIHIKNAKGRKDRIVKLSPAVLETLRLYFKKYKPKQYLFNGQFDLQYSPRSCNQIVKKYIGADYHFHLLRHSSFTALLDSGVDLRIIQKLAGHNSIKTTTIYTHVSTQAIHNIQTPI